MRCTVIRPLAVRRCYAQLGCVRRDRQVAFRLADRVVLGKCAFLQRVAECVLYTACRRDRASEAVRCSFFTNPPGLYRQAVLILAFYFFVRQRAAVVLAALAATRQRHCLRIDRQCSSCLFNVITSCDIFGIFA